VRKCAVFEAAAKYMAARCYRFDLARIGAVCEDLRLSKTELLSGAKERATSLIRFEFGRARFAHETNAREE